jgi:opacity protein-like surface antigen
MKSFAVACLAIFACATSAAAQTGLQLGVHGEAAVANFVGSETAGWQSRTSVGYGGVLVWQPSLAPIGFETGLTFVSKGGTLDESGITTTLKVGYLEVPALLRVALPLPGANIRPTANIGIIAGFRTGCTMEEVGGSLSISGDCTDPAVDGPALKTVDFGAAVGVGVDMAVLPRIVIHPSVSYTRGLSTIDNSSGPADVKNSVFHIGVELRLKM